MRLGAMIGCMSVVTALLLVLSWADLTRTTLAEIQHANGATGVLEGSVIYREGDPWTRETHFPENGTTFVWPADTRAHFYAKGEIRDLPVEVRTARCLVGRPALPYRYIVQYDASKLYLYPGDRLVLERPCWPL